MTSPAIASGGLTLAQTEPGAIAVALLVFGVLMCLSVLGSRAFERRGVPIVLLFLILGILGGSEGIGGIPFENYHLAFRLGTIALVLILLDGGLNTSVSSIRSTLGPSVTLATVGVAGTAGVFALCARALGLTWHEAILVGAIVSSTDAAAVFAVLRGGRLRLKPRVQSTVEVESCLNDPLAVILTASAVAWVAGGATPGWSLLYEIPLQLVIGAVVGAALGWASVTLLRWSGVTTIGLLPVVTLGSAFASFGLATVLDGSGFLAVFVTGVMLGKGHIPYRRGVTRVHDALAWLAQVSMFLMLGLLVFPSRLWPVAGTGLALGLVLALVARPLVAVLCLLPFRFSAREVTFLGWTGLRGAVPIVLATFPVMAGVPGGERVFNIVFFIVVVSTLVPGATIRAAARMCRVGEPAPAAPEASIEMLSLRPLQGEVRMYQIGPDVAVCDAALREVSLPESASVVMVVRGGQVIAARGHTVIRAGDHAYVFMRPEDEPQVGLLFGQSAEG
ncbi:MAG: potassium/proton antiporter [Phycisphaerales bacterium]|nr:potassium/proton antiporter [Phycisphaerales bacterium]